jgi:NAD(P)-dependent dehydrogenase (short-subunit alcohol dehydrogenase family)
VDLDGKAAIVTGAAGNIGSVCARYIAKEGAAVVVADLPGTDVAGITSEISQTGGRALGQEVDLSQEQSVVEMITACTREFGRIDALINVAAAPRGMDIDIDLESMEADFWDRVMAVNVRGAMFACKYALPTMLSQGGGSIVNFTSTAALAGDRGLIAYSTSKAALLGLTRSIATIYGRRGIRCNALAPSGVWPDVARARMGRDFLEPKEQTFLTPRLGVPEDVAHMVVYLASDKSTFITGQTLFVDGGSLAHQAWVRFD